MRHVVDDADGEVTLGVRLGELVEDRLHHRRRELLRRQAVAAGDDPRRDRERRDALGLRFGQRRDDVEIERIAWRARLLRPIEHGEAADGLRQRGEERAARERAIQPDLQHADLLAARHQVLDGFVRRFGARSHEHDHALGGRIADVLEQPVAPAGQLGERLHRALDDLRARVVEAIRRLSRLEEDVGVLRRAAQHRAIGRQPALAMREDQRLGDQRAQVVVGELLDLRDFVRRPEAVEEVQERNARLERRRVRHRGHVVRFLHRVRAQEREAGLAAGHHVGVVAEDRQRVRRERARGHVHHERRQLAGDLVHVGDHQQQALRRREGRRERAGLQRAVHGAGGAGFRLHLRRARGSRPRGSAPAGSTTRRRARPSCCSA